MDKQKPFTLFLPPRLSGSQVSAVKPQTVGGEANYKRYTKCVEDVDFPFALNNLSKNGENMASNPASQKTHFLSVFEQVDNSDSCHNQKGPKDSGFEDSEPVGKLYSKLYKEAEKIKKWKLSAESELKQKEIKLQENRRVIEAQRKAIQELQFENEKVSLKLEEGIQENKDLMKENNATRHLCNVLKETCARSAEKAKKCEYECEETRQAYIELNNNIEKMITAFEDLRVQAENSRLEMCFKLNEDNEKIRQLEEEYKKEVDDKENQVLLLLTQRNEKENKVKDLTFLLEESRDKINQLEEQTKLQNEILKESSEKQDHLISELEDIKMSLQRSMSVQKALEEDLQMATQNINQLTGEKETQMNEFNKAEATHSLVVSELNTTVCNVKELLTAEQQKLEKSEDQLKILTMELQKKSDELEEMVMLKNNKETELEELKTMLEEKQKLLEEKKKFEKIAEDLKGTVEELNALLQTKEKKAYDLEIKLTALATSEQYYSKQVKELETELEEEKRKNTELTANWNTLYMENKELAQKTNEMMIEFKKQQEDINHSNKKEESMLKQIENLEETEIQLRNELESVREELKQKGDEVKCKLETSEENCNNLRKQIENKSKNLEELQKENKALKKKGTEETKQLNSYEIKISKLELELEDAKQKLKDMTDHCQKEIEDKKIVEEDLLREVEKAKVTADEAVKLQKEMDIRCQHKIAEMVALMEKHKHQYDKIVEERDSELGSYKNKEQEQLSMKASLENELSNLKSELLSIKKLLEKETEEKEKLKKEIKENTVALKEKKDKRTQTSELQTPETRDGKIDSRITISQNTLGSANYGIAKDRRDSQWTPIKSSVSTLKAFTVKTPTKVAIHQSVENTNVPTEENNKKRKMVFEFDLNSDSSETTDLLTLISEEENVKKISKNNNSSASHLYVKAPIKKPSFLRNPGSTLKFGTMRKSQEDRWAVISKMDRKKKMKKAEKLFA
ncbi:synaptonemal complex protein 1 [Suncus etruscus]|uniref:synaptonemal complex protein 1 n=1 Tax=Suncus etruscus TaxID=109475 RepID=UPI00210FEFA4|nr:synaptonemal complex protein 1 [Suncus etruscus]